MTEIQQEFEMLRERMGQPYNGHSLWTRDLDRAYRRFHGANVKDEEVPSLEDEALEDLKWYLHEEIRRRAEIEAEHHREKLQSYVDEELDAHRVGYDARLRTTAKSIIEDELGLSKQDINRMANDRFWDYVKARLDTELTGEKFLGYVMKAVQNAVVEKLVKEIDHDKMRESLKEAIALRFDQACQDFVRDNMLLKAETRAFRRLVVDPDDPAKPSPL